MKVFVILFLATVLLAVTVEGRRGHPGRPGGRPPPSAKGCEGRCPRKDPKGTSVYLKNRDCHKFCQCSNGRAIVQDCPKGLHFNARLNVCDWPWKARC